MRSDSGEESLGTPPAAIPAPSLHKKTHGNTHWTSEDTKMPEYKGIEFLRNKLTQKRSRIDIRYRFYEMKHFAADMKISTPPALRGWMASFGWCGKAVDSLADRLVLRTFENDTYGISDIYLMNNQDVLSDSAILGALICACSFIYISQDEDGFPQMRVIDGRDATGCIDPITNMLTEGYAVLESNKLTGTPTVEVYLLPYETQTYVEGKLTGTFKHPAPYPLLVPVIYRPDAKRPFGHSRISRACMDYQDIAARTVKRSEISAEFYSFPQKYVLGMDPDADQMDKWKATMSSMLRFDKDEDGDRPAVGQFQAASQSPHAEQLRMIAGLFAGETGLTLDDLGFPSQNPSSSEAIKASHESLRLTARKAQRTLGTGFLNAGYLAACLRDGTDYKRNQLARTKVCWEPIFEPDITALGAIGDAVGKIQAAFPDYFTEAKLRDLTGI